MTYPKVWNMTAKRFDRIVSKNLTDSEKELFCQFVAKHHHDLPYSVGIIFDRDPNLSKERKVGGLVMMTKLFKLIAEFGEIDYSARRLFQLGLSMNYPGSFELFESFPRWVQKSKSLTHPRYVFSPRTFHSYLKALKETGFKKSLLQADYESLQGYLLRAGGIKTRNSLGAPATPNEIDLHDFLLGRSMIYGVGTVTIRTLYGPEMFDREFSKFIKERFTIHLDDLMHILDNHDQYRDLPANWIINLLSLEDAEK